MEKNKLLVNQHSNNLNFVKKFSIKKGEKKNPENAIKIENKIKIFFNLIFFSPKILNNFNTRLFFFQKGTNFIFLFLNLNLTWY